MIQLNDVSFSYDQKTMVLRHANFTFHPQHHYALKGTNGAGKTTLVKLLLGLIAPSSGQIHRPADITIGYLPDHNGVYPYLTVLQNIQFRLGIYNIAFKEQRNHVEQLLTLFSITQYKDVSVSQLSMGTKKKLALICALVVRGDILILDEPTIGLDEASRINLLHFLVHELPVDSLLLCITHDKDWLASGHFETIVVENGEVRPCTSI